MEDEPRNYPPRLYAEGQSNLDNKDINHSGINHIDTFRESVGETVWNEIKEHPTGIAAKIYEKDIIWSGKTVHYLLCRQLRVRKNEVWFLIGGQPIRFGLNEFEHVTALSTHPLPTEPFEPEYDYRAFFRDLNVPAGEGPTLDELIKGLGKCRAWPPQDIKRKWMGRLFLLTIGIHGLHHNSRIPLESAKRVFDDEALNNYPWGRVAFQSLVGSIKTISPTGRTYTVNGLVQVLQAWAYESITCFGELFGNPSDGDMIPLLRWQGHRTRRVLGSVIDEEIGKKGKVRVRNMIENARGLYPEWPDEPEDPELDNLIQDIADEKFVSGFWDKKMPENEKKNKKKKPDDKDDSQHPKKKHKGFKEREKDKDVDFDEYVGNKSDEPKICNEKEDNMSLRKLIMDMVANFSSRFDNLDTSMNGLYSRIEKVESELTELNKWKDLNLFRIKDLLNNVPKSSASTEAKGTVQSSTEGKGHVNLTPSTVPPLSVKYASSHPPGKDAKSLENVQKNLNTNMEVDDSIFEVVLTKDDGKKKKSHVNLRNKKTVKESKKEKADANKALNDKEALEGNLEKRPRGRPRKVIVNPEKNEEELTSADDVEDVTADDVEDVTADDGDDALNNLDGKSVKADGVADVKANVDNVAADAKADANEALKDKQALDGNPDKRRRGRPRKVIVNPEKNEDRKPDNVKKFIGNLEGNGEELTSAEDALNSFAAEAVSKKADVKTDGDDVHDILDGKANVDEPQKILGEKAGHDEPHKIIGEKADAEEDTDDDEDAIIHDGNEDAMIPESEDDDVDEQTRLKSINDIRNQSVKLSVKGKDTSKLKDRRTFVFPIIRDDGLTCMRKNCKASSAIYDPFAPADPVRVKKLDEHISSTVRGMKLGKRDDINEFYRILITPRRSWPATDNTWGWLNESHIAAYQRVLRGRLITEPCPYHSKGIAFVDQFFTAGMIMDYIQFKIRPKKFKFNGSNYESVVKGLYPDDQQTRMTWLSEVWHVYFVVQSGGDHWLALDVDLARGHIDCYDSIYNPEKKSQVLEACRPIREMIPYMLNDSLSSPSSSSPICSYKPFTFRWKRPKNVPQNENPGDCGVYALKYIECLALGVTFDGLCDANIQGLRLKMAADILAEEPKIYTGFIN